MTTALILCLCGAIACACMMWSAYSHMRRAYLYRTAQLQTANARVDLLSEAIWKAADHVIDSDAKHEMLEAYWSWK